MALHDRRLHVVFRALLRDAGRDPHGAHSRRRCGRHVDRAGSDSRPFPRAARRRLSVITNFAAGMTGAELSHQETKELAPIGAAKLERIDPPLSPATAFASRARCCRRRSSASKRDGETLAAEEIAAIVERPDRRHRQRGPGRRLRHGGLLPRHEPRRGGGADRWPCAIPATCSTGRTSPARSLDKHSTGGIGDNVSLMLAPIVAACGAYRADDLRPRPRPHRRHARQARFDSGLRHASRTSACSASVVADVGCAIIGQTADLAPADGASTPSATSPRRSSRCR